MSGRSKGVMARLGDIVGRWLGVGRGRTSEAERARYASGGDGQKRGIRAEDRAAADTEAIVAAVSKGVSDELREVYERNAEAIGRAVERVIVSGDVRASVNIAQRETSANERDKGGADGAVHVTQHVHFAETPKSPYEVARALRRASAEMTRRR